MKDTIMPLLVQAFYFNAKVHPEKHLIISNIKGVEIHVTADTISDLLEVKRNGVTLYGKDWYATQFVSKNALIVEMFTDEGAHKEQLPSSMLNKEYKVFHNMCQHSIFPRTGSKNKKIALPYGMLLTRIFSSKSKPLIIKDLHNQWFTLGTKNLNHKKKEVDSGNTSTDIGSKRKKVDLDSNSNLLAKASGEQSENVLPTGENVDIHNVVSDPQPTTLNKSLHLRSTVSHEIETSSQRAGKILQGFYSTTTPMNTSVFSPIMISSHGSLQSMFSTDFVRNLMTSNSPDPSQVPVPSLYDSNF
ncbi:unnamed protein product [Trifolium pratense]|uniref:Uncharacterized protein n=1 Tax=Trifolium pratense TaxID=57577 RepID=A0ACB0LKW3_TRIPR|nr:unnamed protein product [Trifolium pratense]